MEIGAQKQAPISQVEIFEIAEVQFDPGQGTLVWKRSQAGSAPKCK